MKIEKLTDNKIRIIVSLDDLKEKNIDSKASIKSLQPSVLNPTSFSAFTRISKIRF